MLPNIVLVHDCPSVINWRKRPFDSSWSGHERTQNLDTLLRDYPQAYQRFKPLTVDELHTIGMSEDHKWAQRTLSHIHADLTALNLRGTALLSAFAGINTKGIIIVGRSGKNWPFSSPSANPYKPMVIYPSQQTRELTKKSTLGLGFYKETPFHDKADPNAYDFIKLGNILVHETSHVLDKDYSPIDNEISDLQHSGTKIYRLLADIEDYYLPRSASRLAYDTAAFLNYDVREYDGGPDAVRLINDSYAEHFAQLSEFFMSGERPHSIKAPLTELYMQHIVDLDLQLLNSQLPAKKIEEARLTLHTKLNGISALSRGIHTAVTEVRLQKDWKSPLNFKEDTPKLLSFVPEIDKCLSAIAEEIRCDYGLPRPRGASIPSRSGGKSGGIA